MPRYSQHFQPARKRRLKKPDSPAATEYNSHELAEHLRTYLLVNRNTVTAVVIEHNDGSRTEFHHE